MYANEINLMKAFRYMIEGAREYKNIQSKEIDIKK